MISLSLIVAAADDNAIGINNGLPWHLPEDLRFFKRTTMGKPVIMGRRTFESVGRPLPGRTNVILTRNKDYQAPEGVLVFDTLQPALDQLEAAGQDEVFVIGGGELFRETMHDAAYLYLTRVHCTIPGADTFFPHVDHGEWLETWKEEHPADDKHEHAYTFYKYERTEL